MGVIASHLTTDSSTTNNASFSTASISPTAGKLVLLFVRTHRTGGGDPATPTVSGCSLTWVQVRSDRLTVDSSHRVSLFRAMGSSTAGTVTVDFSGQNQDERAWTVSEVSGVDVSGTNGSGAIVQSAFGEVAAGADPRSFSVTLSSFSNNANATFGAMSTNVNSSITEGSGFTVLGLDSSPGLQSQWKASNDTSVDWTYTGSSFAGAIAVELKADISGGGGIFPAIF